MPRIRKPRRPRKQALAGWKSRVDKDEYVLAAAALPSAAVGSVLRHEKLMHVVAARRVVILKTPETLDDRALFLSNYWLVVARVLAAYGLDHFDPEKQIHLSIVEAGPRILAGLPDYLAEATQDILESLNVEVMCGEKVTGARVGALDTASGKMLSADFVVWAAGVRAPDVLKQLDGLGETNLLLNIHHCAAC